MRDPTRQLQILLVAAFLIGGGGAAYGFNNLIIQLGALFVLGANGSAVWNFVRNGPRFLVFLCIATLLLPLIQIIPLPPTAWTALPGRDLVGESLAATGKVGWFPLSMDVGRTLVSFLGLLLPFTIVAVGWQVDRKALVQMAWLLVILAFLAIVPGTLQVVTDGNVGIPYPENTMPGVLFGTFANRNSTGLFFVIALVMLASLPAAKPGSVLRYAKGAMALLLVLAVILTQSRSSMALLAIPAAVQGLRAAFGYLHGASSRNARGSGSPTTRNLLFGALIGAVILVAGTVAATSSRIETSLSRYNELDNPRPNIWEDGRYAAERYWPAGAGMGTFDEVFQVDESLEYVTLRKAGRAHNDYLEVSIEAGIVGLGLIVGWFLWSMLVVFRIRRPQDRQLALGALAAMACVALQSCLDYPLRNQTMLGVAGLMVLILAQAITASREAKS